MYPSFLPRPRAVLLCCMLAIAGPAIASPPQLIADFSSAPGRQWGSFPRGFVTSGQNVFFLATTPDDGEELHAVDQVTLNEQRLTDVSPGPASSSVRDLVPAPGGGAWFVANSNELTTGVWFTDGTVAGTHLVLTLSTTSPSEDCQFAPGASRTFIACTGDFSGSRLWSSDGTPTGTIELAPSNYGGHWAPDALLVGPDGFANALYVGSTVSLVRSDGTPAGTTSRATDLPTYLVYGAAFAPTGDYTVIASNNSHVQVWTLAALAGAGTKIFDQPAASPFYTGMVGLPTGIVFSVFAGTTTADPSDFWFTDGTSAGTRKFASMRLDVGVPFERLGDHALIRAHLEPPGFDYGNTVWTTDGSAAGTQPLVIPDYNKISDVSYPRTVGDVAYFSANDQTAPGTCIYRTDGTRGGTRPYGACGVYHGNSDVGGSAARLFHPGSDEHGGELWTSLDSPGAQELFRDLYPGTESTMPNYGAEQSLVAARVGANVFFSVTQVGDYTAPIRNAMLVTDGSHGVLSSPAEFQNYPIYDIAVAGQRVGVQTRSSFGGISSTDASGGDVQALETYCYHLALVATTSKFIYQCATFDPGVLWATDGISNNKTSIAFPNQEIEFLETVLPHAYFFSDGKLWRTDGTSPGTTIVSSDLRSCMQSVSAPREAALPGGFVIEASTSIDPCRPWFVSESAGTATQLPSPLALNGTLAKTYELHAFAGKAIFAANLGGNGETELWSTDGTAANTKMFAHLSGVSLKSIVVAGTRALVQQTTDTRSFVTDGVTTTPLVLNAPSFDGRVGSDDGRVFGSASDSASGSEPYQLDLATGALTMLADLWPGPVSSGPTGFFVTDTQLFFFAKGPGTGVEPYSMPLGGIFRDGFE